MGGQALSGADVGMAAADEVDVFIGGVQLALLCRGGDAGRGGLDQTCLFQVFKGVFQTAPLGFFIGVVVVGGLGGFVQAFWPGRVPVRSVRWHRPYPTLCRWHPGFVR